MKCYTNMIDTPICVVLNLAEVFFAHKQILSMYILFTKTVLISSQCHP